MNDNIATSKSYFETLMRAANGVVASAVDQVATELLNAYFADRAIYVLGNGGSAATASHFACDLSKGVTNRLPDGVRRMRAVALTDNAALMTAWANDTKYENIFAEQLKTFVRAGDIVIAISASGKSANVLNGLQAARSAGATTVGLSGFDGGHMLCLCDHCVVVPSNNVEVIEDIHLAICHSLATVARAALQQASSDGLASPWLSGALRSPGAYCAIDRPRASGARSSLRSVNSLLPVVSAGKSLVSGQEHPDAD